MEAGVASPRPLPSLRNQTSTNWSSKRPPDMPITPTQRFMQSSHPLPSAAPQINVSGNHRAVVSIFHEEHPQRDDMMRDVPQGSRGDGLNRAPDGSAAEENNLALGPILSSPGQINKSPRTLHKPSLKCLVSNKATHELLENIVRVAWVGDLQHALCMAAVAIHKDLRKCFHEYLPMQETANRVSHITTKIFTVMDSWTANMTTLQQAIDSMDVARDTPNLMKIHKDQHGAEVKRFRQMLEPIPTQVGAECNSRIAVLMHRLYDDEVRAPFQQAMHENGDLLPCERLIMSYLTQLSKKFIVVQKTADRLHTSTVSCWQHWTRMGEEIAKHAALMQSNSPASVAQRAKDAVSRALHQGKARPQNKDKAPRAAKAASGSRKPKPPLVIGAPRPGVIMDTTFHLPVHPLDADPKDQPLDIKHTSFWHLIRKDACSDPSTPQPGDGAHSLPSTSLSTMPSPHGSADASLNRNQDSREDPFAQHDSDTGRHSPQNALEYHHNSPNIPFHSGDFDDPSGATHQQHTTAGSAQSKHSSPDPFQTPFIHGVAYYKVLKDFYHASPPRPDPDTEPELSDIYNRAMTLRRLEGGPPPPQPPPDPTEEQTPMMKLLAAAYDQMPNDKPKHDDKAQVRGSGVGGRDSNNQGSHANDLFAADSDPEMYATDEEEPWHRV